MKVFKFLRPLLLSTGIVTDASILDMNENDSYNMFFSLTPSYQCPYDLVLVLKDGSRWKLDAQTYASKKLNMLLDPENIVRFECIITSERAQL